MRTFGAPRLVLYHRAGDKLRVQAESGQNNQNAAQPAARILVVDDSPTFRRAIGSMLARAGYTVETAASGEEAFARCFEETFDVVVSDVTMGALSGVQLCRLFRSDPATKDIPVVLLTAADDPRSRFWARNAGAAAYVAKERARQELLPEVERVLNAAPGSMLPVRTRAGRRAQPMERLSQVLDELLFRAVVQSELRRLTHHTGDRRQFCAQFLSIAAEVSDYSYLVLKLNSPEDTTYAVHARGPWPEQPGAKTLEILELPKESGPRLDVTCDHGAMFTGADPGLEFKDKAKYAVDAAGEALGTLVAIGKDKRLGGDDRATLELLSKELGVLVKNVFLLEETRRLANSDGLTGLQNRRRATERLDAEIARARRYGTPLSLLLCDVDHFKQVNDRFGHNMGDEVLVRVASQLHETLRQVDLVGRWGGEEFLVLLPDTDTDGARIVGERLRLAIEAMPPFHQGPSSVTCSVGIANYQGEENSAVFVDRADQALYKAKKGGRNRCELG
jgi:two-component system cell cycle response regulator